jgi:flavin reductase (DIM6/NTAB) family NADH-FMN oxidoreductase RutF
MDHEAKKTVLGQLTYGLYAISVAHKGSDHAMAAAIENGSQTIEMVRDAHHFGVNVLQSGQRDLAAKLGRTSEQAPQKLKGIKTKPGPVSGAPILVDALG